MASVWQWLTFTLQFPTAASNSLIPSLNQPHCERAPQHGHGASVSTYTHVWLYLYIYICPPCCASLHILVVHEPELCALGICTCMHVPHQVDLCKAAARVPTSLMYTCRMSSACIHGQECPDVFASAPCVQYSHINCITPCKTSLHVLHCKHNFCHDNATCAAPTT